MAFGIRRPRTRKDSNSAELIRAMRRMGVVVYDIESPTDLLVVWRGKPMLVEIKTPGASLRPSQATVAGMLDAGYFARVESLADVVRLFSLNGGMDE